MKDLGTTGEPMKLVKRDQMSGQEKYESDKDRGEAEKSVASMGVATNRTWTDKAGAKQEAA